MKIKINNEHSTELFDFFLKIPAQLNTSPFYNNFFHNFEKFQYHIIERDEQCEPTEKSGKDPASNSVDETLFQLKERGDPLWSSSSQ